MRVLWISKASVSASYRKKLAWLSRMGVEVGVITGDAWDPWQFEASPDDGLYTLLRLKQRLSGRNHLHWYHALGQAISEFGPDLMHIDEEHYSAVTFQAARWARRVRIPYIFQTWQNIYKSYPPPFSLMERYVFNHACAALAGTPEIEHVLVRQGFTGPVHIIPLGVDTDVFFPDPQRAYRDQFKTHDQWALGFIGRLVPEKGILDMAQAVLPQLREHPDWRWVIAGSGPLEETLRVLIAPHLEQIDIVPWLSTHDMAHLMNALDLLVVPSKTTSQWKEQFGRVLIEAMAVGLPVVAYSSGAIPDVLQNAGLIVPEGDIGALQTAMLRFYSSPDLSHQLRQRGLTRAATQFSQREIATKLFSVYQGILPS